MSEDEADHLAEELEHLPLAITQAAGYLAEAGMTAASYLELLHERVAEVLTRGAPSTYPVSLAASWALALSRLAVDQPAALELLGLAALLAPEPIPFTLFTTHPDRLPARLAAAASDPLAFTDLTGLLRRRALARIGTESLQLHRLVQAILRTHPTSTDRESSQDNRTMVLGLLRAAVPAEPWDEPETWPAWRALLPHVLTATDTSSDPNGTYGDDLAWLLDRAATYLHARGELRSTRPLFDRALHLRQQLLGQDHPDTLITANNLARYLSALGEHTAARQLDEDTLTRKRRVLGEDHPSTLLSANSLAADLSALGEHTAARQLDEDTLTRRRRVLGEDHPSTLLSANNFAADLRELGEYEQARQLDEDIFSRKRRVLGEDHPSTLTTANNLATDLSALGEHTAARQLDEDTLTRSRRVLGEDHPSTLTTANNLATDLSALGEHLLARKLEEWVRSQHQA